MFPVTQVLPNGLGEHSLLLDCTALSCTTFALAKKRGKTMTIKNFLQRRKSLLNVVLTSLSISSILVVLFSLNACEERGDPNKESFTKGSTTLYCDTEFADMMRPLIDKYRGLHSTGSITLSVGDARNGMAQLLAAKTRLLITGREYLPDEDSLMKVFHVAPHKRFHLATDALVFFARKDIEIDSLSVEALAAQFGSGVSLKRHIVNLSFEPQFVLPSVQSSIVANVRRYCCNEKNISSSARTRYYSSIDSVKESVSKDKQSIGVGYLSQLASDTARFKLLRIRHTDADSNRSSCSVHQSSVYRELYPYPVKIWAYLLEDLRNYPMGVASFLAFEADPQAFFMNRGIVPAYAKIKLYEEE